MTVGPIIGNDYLSAGQPSTIFIPDGAATRGATHRRTAMKLTRRHKALIRAHWSHYKLRFRADGSVEAQDSRGAPWARLYTARDAERHIEAIGARKPDRA